MSREGRLAAGWRVARLGLPCTICVVHASATAGLMAGGAPRETVEEM